MRALTIVLLTSLLLATAPVQAVEGRTAISGTILMGDLGLAVGTAAARTTGVSGVHPGFGFHVYADAATMKVKVPATRACAPSVVRNCGELVINFHVRDETGLGQVGPVGIGIVRTDAVPLATASISVYDAAGALLHQSMPGMSGRAGLLLPQGDYVVSLDGHTGAAMRFSLVAETA